MAESLPAVAIPIFAPDPLGLVLNLMVVFVFVLIGPGVLLGMLAQDRKIMGSHVSGMWWKVAYWLSLALILSFGIIAIAVV